MNTATPDLFTLGDHVAPYALNNDYDVIAHALAIVEGKLRLRDDAPLAAIRKAIIDNR